MIHSSLFFWSVAAFAFLFGSLIGSFLNVVIYRVPAGLSIVSPPSRCPSCETPIQWYDNIPIFSWLVLRGRCRSCKIKIPARYAMVEALTGLLAAGVWWRVAGRLLEFNSPVDPMVLAELAPVFFLHFTLVAFLVAITFIDLDHFLIPHVVSVPGIVVALAAPWILSGVYGNPNYLGFWPPVTPAVSLAGAIAGFLTVVAIFYLYLAARGIEGIGGGDATLMALIGGWLGWPALPFVFFAASAQGIAAAGLSIALGGNFARDSREIFDEDEEQEHREEQEPADLPATDVTDGATDEEGVDAELPPDDPVEQRSGEPASADANSGAADSADEESGDWASGESLEPGEEALDQEGGKLAVPFGPFLSLAALEFYYFGPLLPAEFAMTYFYY